MQRNGIINLFQTLSYADFQAEAVQTMIGAVAHMAFENLVNVYMEVTRLNKTISQFEEAEVEIKDPRKEMHYFRRYQK